MFEKEVLEIAKETICGKCVVKDVCTRMDDACEEYEDSLRALKIGAEFGYNKAKEEEKWNYCKDELPKLGVSTTVNVIAVYLNAFDNPCKIDCFFNGINFVYWDSSCTKWVNVSKTKGNVYAWKYADELPPKED